MWKRYKNEPTDNYFYLAGKLAKCLVRLNSHVGPVITQMTNTKKMNNFDMITQKTHNLHVCSTDNSKYKMIKVVER